MDVKYWTSRAYRKNKRRNVIAQKLARISELMEKSRMIHISLRDKRRKLQAELRRLA